MDTAVSDFAVGKPPTVAARHGERISVFDGRTWKELPPTDAPSSVTYALFFGRDNQPRLMGYEAGAEPRAFYRRFKGGRFQPEPSELGPLGSARGALYGVLGFADPEVVCKPRELCLIKRISGWGRVPAHEVPVPVFLGRADAWAFMDHTLQHLDSAGFRDFSPSRRFEKPSALWADERGLPWVLDDGALWRVSADAGWTRSAVPLASARALTGTKSSDVWVAGEGGAAWTNGTNFRCLRELAVPLSGVTQAGEDIWLWGTAGAFRVRRAAGSRSSLGIGGSGVSGRRRGRA